MQRYAELCTEKETAVKIAEQNKRKYELNMLQVHKIFNDPSFREANQAALASGRGGFDRDSGIFREIEGVR